MGVSAQAQDNDTKKAAPTLDEFIVALILIGPRCCSAGKPEANSSNTEWLAYRQFHAGQYEESLATYQPVVKLDDADQNFNVYAAVRPFYLGRYVEAQRLFLRALPPRCATELGRSTAHAVADEEVGAVP
jgi:tetratricopeptide (TPR) repeat protein